jgi:uncharacterized protein YjdB
MSGTQGRALRLEAIQIELTDAMKDNYDVYYRVHSQNIGWMGWAKNGESAGTANYGYRLDGIQLVLVQTGGAVPGSTAGAFQYPLVKYNTHVENIGWQDQSMDGGMAGTTGQSLRLEGIHVDLSDQLKSLYSGSIQYKTHVQDYGWETNWKANGAMSGTSGQAKRLEAIQIKLTGVMGQKYDVYYRVHCENFGWMGWAKNGESSGSAGFSYRLEGIQIVLVPKGGAAPGRTSGAFVQK